MNIKLTRQIKRGGSFVKKGTPLTVSDKEGQSLIENGIAQPYMTYASNASQTPVNNGVKAAVEELAAKILSYQETANEATGDNGSGDKTGDKTADTGDNGDNTEEDLDETTDSEQSEKDAVDTSSFRVIEETTGKQESTGPYLIPGVDSVTIDVLVKNGYTTIESLKAATIDALVALPKVGYQKAKKIADYVKSL